MRGVSFLVEILQRRFGPERPSPLDGRPTCRCGAQGHRDRVCHPVLHVLGNPTAGWHASCRCAACGVRGIHLRRAGPRSDPVRSALADRRTHCRVHLRRRHLGRCAAPRAHRPTRRDRAAPQARRVSRRSRAARHGQCLVRDPDCVGAGNASVLRTELFVPISNSLYNAGVGVGAIVALTISGAGANLPEFIVLSKMAKPGAIGIFFVYVFAIATTGGLLAHSLAG